MIDQTSAAALYDQGLTDLAIAKRIGVSGRCVTYWRHSTGRPTLRTRSSPGRIGKNILILHARGWSTASIAEELDTSSSYVSAVVKRSKIMAAGGRA